MIIFLDNLRVYRHEHSRRCAVHCGPSLQMFTGETEASREVKELSTTRALRIYCLAHHGQKNGQLHEQSSSFMQ